MPNRLDRIADLAEKFEQWAARSGVPASAVAAINLMLDELISNVVMHGYPAHERGEIHVSARLVPAAVLVEISDHAFAYDPLQTAQPDLTSDLESRAIGGLGVHFVRQLADEFDYQRLELDGRMANRVRILKRYALP